MSGAGAVCSPIAGCADAVASRPLLSSRGGTVAMSNVTAIQAMSGRLPTVIAARRTVLGIGLMAAPSLTASTYLGESAYRHDLRFMSRRFGGLDVALGLALAIAYKTNPELRREILLIGAACDAWDATCAVPARDALPPWCTAFFPLPSPPCL